MFAEPVVTYLVPKALLICSSNDTTSCPVAGHFNVFSRDLSFLSHCPVVHWGICEFFFIQHSSLYINIILFVMFVASIYSQIIFSFSCHFFFMLNLFFFYILCVPKSNHVLFSGSAFNGKLRKALLQRNITLVLILFFQMLDGYLYHLFKNPSFSPLTRVVTIIISQKNMLTSFWVFFSISSSDLIFSRPHHTF